MTKPIAAALLAVALCCPAFSEAVSSARPKSGKVEILKLSELKPGMKGTAWTVFSGNVPEPVPVEIIGLWKNAWGPKQDIIIGKLGGKAERTNVAGGMSGSPVYIDGKLAGAISLRMSVFSPDAICGITPIELMMEIKDFDKSRPTDARTPDKIQARAGLAIPGDMLSQAVAAGASPNLLRQQPLMVPIETPLTFSGFQENVLREFAPIFQQLGMTAVQGGASGALSGSKPGPGWQSSLQPGDAVAGVLVSGDMSVTGLGTVTSNDGSRVLAFGHPFFNLGPVEMPMSKGEVIMVLSSQYQPNKFANATEIVGALKQDRHSGIMGVLGEQAKMIPVTVKVRSFDEKNAVRKEKDFHFNVCVQQKWTPYLMMFTLFNSISGLNDFSDEATYRLSGQVELDGQQKFSISTIQAQSEVPIPAPMVLAGWWGDKFSRLFQNAVTTPNLKSVNVAVDLLPERRVASVENAWVDQPELLPGKETAVKVFLRPYRGERFERSFKIKLPEGLPHGEYRLLLSDAETMNRVQASAGHVNRFIDVPQTVSLINQERSNDKLYISLIQSRPTLFADDKTMPSLPASVLNVMQSGRSPGRPYVTSAETAQELASLPFDYMVSGSYSLKVIVR